MNIRNYLALKLTTLFLFTFIFLQTQAQNQGDTITVNYKKYVLKSANLISNPGFESGFTGWTDATSTAATLTTGYFSIPTSGGVNNSGYLIGTTNSNSSSAGSIGTGWRVTAGKSYYFSYYVKQTNSALAASAQPWLKVSLTNDKTNSAEPFKLIDTTYVSGNGQWTKNELAFTNNSYSWIVARFRWLNNNFGFDEFRLFETEEINVEVNLENANEENPVDMTDYIVNQGFDNNTTEGWKNAGTVNNHEVEFYQKTFDMYQTIKNLPAGKYRLTAKGFERPKLNDSGIAFKNGAEQIHAKFYATASNFSELNVSFPSIYTVGFTGSGSLNGYVNTMASAETVLNASNSNYKATISNIVLDQGGTLIVGAKTEFQQNGYWALLDNFRLEYTGKVDAYAMRIAIRNRISEAIQMKSLRMQTSALAFINSTTTHADSILTNDSLSLDSLWTEKSRLDLAIVNATASVEACKNLAKALDNARRVLVFLDKSDEIDKLNNAINTAESSFNDLDLTLAQINSASSVLRAVTRSVGKQIYIPGWMMGNVNDPANNWSMERSKESKNWILFWEPGFGDYPGAIVDDCLNLAEKCFYVYADSLKFVKRGASKTDQYKMIIRLRYGTDWEASGSGVDNTIGLLTLTSWALSSRGGQTIAHEVGHCFQYQVHCDNNDNNGWMYGYGAAGAGGNGWWEQCAQWQAYQVFPEQEFSSEWFTGYLEKVHKHPLHEAPRYNNYFIQDFWSYKRGRDLIGKLWNQSRYPEDPIETYKRIHSLTQAQFNDEMFECGARFASWDIPALITAGNSRIASRPQPKMANAGNNFWKIDSTFCLENYGHNIIRLNVPIGGKTVTVSFEGLAGTSGYRKLYPQLAGWRFGFVAMKSDGTRYYGDMQTASMSVNEGKAIISFDCPASAYRLWLVVTGAPTSHWRHAWDDNDSNDEQWPYQVKFNNTNYFGFANVVNGIEDNAGDKFSYCIDGHRLQIKDLPYNSLVRIYDLEGRLVQTSGKTGNEFSCLLNTGIYILKMETSEGLITKEIIVR